MYNDKREFARVPVRFTRLGSVMVTCPLRNIPNVRRWLSADGLHDLLRAGFAKVRDPRGEGATISTADALMSSFVMFSLKDPSLLAFDKRRHERNLQNLYGIKHVASDTQMREILDPLDPEQFRPIYGDVFRKIQRGNVLERFAFYKGCYLLLMDGTKYFSSETIHCDSCLEKIHRETGNVPYQHQMLGVVLAHPDHREVIPLAPEPIVQQDGRTKNDCERNAAKRLLPKIRKEHPRLNFIVVEDGLASNAPHIRELKAWHMHFILGVKPGDHRFLFDQVAAAIDNDRLSTISWKLSNGQAAASFINNIPLNESNQDLLVNFLHYVEYGSTGRNGKSLPGSPTYGLLAPTPDCSCAAGARGGRSKTKPSTR